MNQKFKLEEKSHQLPLIVRKPITVINRKLYEKYQHSQNYYYIREINEILSDTSTRVVIHYKDLLAMDEEEEYLKRYYLQKEFPQKITLLTEYYKFHQDIARIFQEPICTLINKYYDKKRKYDYFRIAKIIEEENKLNPQKPPKGIVGERPSPVNSQESFPQERDNDDQDDIKITQVLKELSWLKNNNIQILPTDASQTIKEIYYNIGFVEDQPSLSIVNVQKNEKVSLDNFLLYIGNKAQKKQCTSPYTKKSQEQLIQDLILRQKAKIQQKDSKNFSLHNKNDNKYSIGQMEIKNLFIKDQCNNLSKKSNRQASTDIIESVTKLDSKPQESVKMKQKTQITKNQYKMNKIIRDVNTNYSPTPSMHKISICSSQLKTQQPQSNLKINSLAKLLIEDSSHDTNYKSRNGAVTHRPLTGTNAFFASNSNRNSPSINYKKLISQKTQIDKQKKSKNLQLYQQKDQIGQLAKNLFTKAQYYKKQKTISHQKQNSNQLLLDKQQYKNYQLIQDLTDKKQHKKNKSDGKTIYNKLSLHDMGCLTDRHDKQHSIGIHIHNNTNSSPSTQHFRRLHSEKQDSISSNLKGLMIQQMLKQLAKQNQQHSQLKLDLRCIKNSNNINNNKKF